MSQGRELTPLWCSRATPLAPDNADTADNEDNYRSCYSIGHSDGKFSLWYLMGTCGPHRSQPPTQALPP